jgi:(2Fe-2S) ferredoxin
VKSFRKTCVFVCTRKGGCGDCGSKKLVKELKKRIKMEDLNNTYKVIECGCLGYCSQEIAAVVFPENIVFTKLGKKDADRLVSRLESQRQFRINHSMERESSEFSKVVSVMSH